MLSDNHEEICTNTVTGLKMVNLPHQVRVCIVGAGVSGLGAAQRLIQSGIDDLLILEAGDRIGGRVNTVEHREHILEFGAHWIHGEEGNVVFQWASENGLVEDDVSLLQTGIGDTVFVRRNGEIVSQEVIDAFSMAVANIAESSEKDFYSYPHSSGQYYTEKFKTRNEWGILGEELLDWHGRFQNCIDGSDNWFEVSAKGHTQYKECPGSALINWKEKGYKNLILHLKETLPSSCLFLRSPVKAIDWGIATSASTSGCKVTLTSDQVIHADHVIFTASLGVLKAMAKDMFNPPLPRRKLNAVEGLGMGIVDKVYLQFPHRWWDDDCIGFSLLNNLQEMPAMITKENWEQGLLGFYEVYKQTDMMCAWITGSAALMMEQTPEEEVAQRCVALLRKFLSSRFQVPNAVWWKRSSWGSSALFRGSYSLRTMKTEAMGVQALDLAEPLQSPDGIPLVCFAGEATHDCYYSTVHGALETGWREADRLTNYFKSLQNSLCQQVRACHKYNVIIIGAGAAGIGAARELTRQGINSILIVEGNDRIGGRVNTTLMAPEVVVELGAQWIHGEEGNAVFQFAKSRNLIHDKLSVDGKGHFFVENGKKIPEKVVTQVMKVLREADDECGKYCYSKKFEGLAQLSVGDIFSRKFSKYLAAFKCDSPETKKVKKALYHWGLRWHRIDNACDSLHQLSARCWGTFIFCPGNENMNPKSGFISILHDMLAETRADVRLNSEVKSINYAEEVMVKGDIYVRPDCTTYPVNLRCKDGTVYEAQHVIVTSSIGYLKAHPELFIPSLPKRLQKAITSVGYGTIDKIFLEYEDAWWSEDCEGIHLVWTEDIPDFERRFPHTKLFGGKTELMNEYWMRAISGFDPVFSQKAMLCGWIGGPEAEYMEELSELTVGQACTNLLRHFTGRKDIPYPKKVYRSQWASNHLFRGSYSYHPVGCDCITGELNENLNTPVCAITKDGDKVPVVVLAGEANSKAQYSTVHGALRNGIAQTAHYVHTQKRLGKHQEEDVTNMYVSD
ncbi:uncharacterized protein [Panulirus ornatus]|uniref:uncharacterized protein isoform X2 n=1 Tax=Panulirus ornatus TaxID=150431 RepID=UPI003A87B647